MKLCWQRDTQEKASYLMAIAWVVGGFQEMRRGGLLAPLRRSDELSPQDPGRDLVVLQYALERIFDRSS
jgi:hypothetical protein